MTGGESPLVHLVPLTGAELPVVERDGDPWIVFSPSMEGIGLNPEAQLRRLRRQPWARVERVYIRGSDGRRRPTNVVPVPTFLMFVATVEAPRVTDARARKALIAYQCETSEKLADYWTKGLAVNPRGRTPEQIRLIEAAGEGLVGPVMEHSADAWGALQYLEGRRDMSPGMTTAQVTSRLYRAVRNIHESVIDAGLDAAWALKRGEQ